MAIREHDVDDPFVTFIKETCLAARQLIIEAVHDRIADPAERTHLIENVLGYLLSTWIAARSDDDDREAYFNQFAVYLKASVEHIVKAKKELEQEREVKH